MQRRISGGLHFYLTYRFTNALGSLRSFDTSYTKMTRKQVCPTIKLPDTIALLHHLTMTRMQATCRPYAHLTYKCEAVPAHCQ